MKNDHLDVLIVGAGLSGIAAGYHLQNESPDRSYAILERREAIGGTWDLFRYPGIRSDSDMHTLGYSFRPWRSPKAIADGTSIREYVQDTARENGIDKKIRYGLKVVSASWSTPDARWTVEAERTESGEKVELTANFLFMCSGYYNYDQGYTPEFEGIADFGGRIVHPQKWTDDIDYANKKVVVIGKRRNRGHSGSGNGEDRGARDHAATLSDLYRVDAVRGCHCQLPAQQASGKNRLCAHAMEEHPLVLVHLPPLPSLSRSNQEKASATGPRKSWRRSRHQARLHPELQPLGPTDVHGPRWRPVQCHQIG